MTEILLKVALNAIKQTNKQTKYLLLYIILTNLTPTEVINPTGTENPSSSRAGKVPRL
jgi:hypothetical protein